MKLDSKRRRASVALVAGVLLLSACGGAATTTAAPGTTAAPTTAAPTTAGPSTTAGAMLEHIPFAVGAMVDQTGALSGIVEAVSQPLNMAVAEINAVSPDLVSVEFADDGTDQTIAGTNIEAFLDGSKNAVMGPLASGVAASVWDKVNTAHMVMCSGTSTGSAFSAPEYNPNHVRTAPSDDIQGPLLGNIVVEDGNANVAVAWRQDVYGEGFGNALADAVEEAGATLSYREGYDPKPGTSYTTVAQDIVASGAEALALISFAEGGQIVQDLAAAGWEGQTYIADGFVDNIKVDTLGGRADLVTGFQGTYPAAAPASGEATFASRFAAFAPDAPTVFSAHQYDCFVVMTLAAQVAQSNDPAVYVEEIIGVTRDGEKCSLVADCLEKVWAGVDIDYDGASGPLDFSENGEPGVGVYDTVSYTGAAQEDDPATEANEANNLIVEYGEQITGNLPSA